MTDVQPGDDKLAGGLTDDDVGPSINVYTGTALSYIYTVTQVARQYNQPLC